MVFRSSDLSRPSRRRVLASSGVLALALSGCGRLEEMEFVQDDRLVIENPENLATVELPLEVRWRMSDFTPTTTGPFDSRHAQFAVFVNQYPMAPGEDVSTITDRRRGCEGNADCLAPQFLVDTFGIHVTDRMSIVLERLPTAVAAATDGNFINIVLVDGDLRRIGEAVWYTSFRFADQEPGS